MLTTNEAEMFHQLAKCVEELEAAHAQGRANIFEVRKAGGIACLLSRPDLTTRLEAIVAGMTVKDFFANAITNIDPNDVDVTRIVKFALPEEVDRQHPLCDDRGLLDYMSRQDDPHLQLCFSGDIEGAVQRATSSRAIEDIGCTLAALGQSERAIAFIDAQPVTDVVKAHVRFVILLETCRRGFPGAFQAVQDANVRGGRLEVVLALAGRLPWAGYPYSDW